MILFDILPYYMLGCIMLQNTTLNFSLFHSQKQNLYQLFALNKVVALFSFRQTGDSK